MKKWFCKFFEYISVSNLDLLDPGQEISVMFNHPAHVLRVLGLLLADSVLKVGWGKTFWRVGRVPSQKTDVTWKQKVAE